MIHLAKYSVESKLKRPKNGFYCVNKGSMRANGASLSKLTEQILMSSQSGKSFSDNKGVGGKWQIIITIW